MFWCDKLLEKVDGPQMINDSKTPSGRVHVGALRGVLIHDAVFRLLKDRGIKVRYLFGVDDYDPLDEIPSGQKEHFEPYLGVPLCNVPPPEGSTATDMAEHYIGEFFDIFKELGVETENYRMRDIYRSGDFNEIIDTILSHKDSVRKIYKDVSNSDRPENWHPFQVICEKCGKIGASEVTAYDGKEVQYKCHENLVTWARGCGYEGKISPFNGNGKLPWKLEWVAKWKAFNISIEGAGKDHSTKGGSRDVASHCFKQIFRQKPPLNIPYEFFLVGGAKMSSSRGLGVSAREMADFLPPEVLRFLMLRTQAKRPVNFSPDETYITKIFNEFDRFQHRTFHDPKITESDKWIYKLAEVKPGGEYETANFQLVTALAQMPHLDVEKEIEKHKGSSLSSLEKKHLERRISSARYWVDHYAAEDEKTILQETLPASAAELSSVQRAFLHLLSEALATVEWDHEALQSKIFHISRITPIKQPLAFEAIYRVLLNRQSGPKAGNLLYFLKPDFIINRFKELSYSKIDFWLETGINDEELEEWLKQSKSRIKSGFIRVKAAGESSPIEGKKSENEDHQCLGIIEFYVTLDDDKEHCKRLLIKKIDSKGDENAPKNGEFEQYARGYVDNLFSLHKIVNISANFSDE